MLTTLWLVLATLVASKAVLWWRNRALNYEQVHALDRQIYRLHHVLALAKEDEAFREMRAKARGER